MSKLQPPADFYRADGWGSEESIGWLLRRVMNSILLQADRRLLPHDLTHAQWVPLYKLHSGECATVAGLARETQTDPAAITRAIDRLEAKGLIQRVRSVDDRRVVRLALTEEGERAASLVPAALSEIFNNHLAGFTRAEWETLMNLLRRMAANGDALRCEPEKAAE